MELPELPPEWDWANVMKLGDECDEASVLIYGAEVASRMKVAGLMLKQMPQIMRAYGEQCILLERERTRALVLDDSWALTFQTFGQYRTALAAAIRKG